MSISFWINSVACLAAGFVVKSVSFGIQNFVSRIFRYSPAVSKIGDYVGSYIFGNCGSFDF